MPLRTHLQAIADSAGAGFHTDELKRLEPLELPPAVAHVWQWWCDIADGRQGGMGGGNLYTEIRDWAELTGAQPSAFEVECMAAIDREQRRSQQKNEK